MQQNSIIVALYVPLQVSKSIYDMSKSYFTLGTKIIMPQDYHITLAYLSDIRPLQHDLLVNIINGFTANEYPITGLLGGVGRFTRSENGDTNAFYTSLDAPLLAAFRQRLVEKLEQYNFRVSKEHGFVPHCTIAYIPSAEPTPPFTIPAMGIRFNKLWLVIKDDRYGFSLDKTVNQLKQRMGQQALAQMVGL